MIKTDKEEDDSQSEKKVGTDSYEKFTETVQVLEPKEWEDYLRQIDVDQSLVTLKNALSRPEPTERDEALWLDKVKDCPLFMEMVWYHSLRKQNAMIPFTKRDLSQFIVDCADYWELFAQSVADGKESFEVMKQVVELEPDAIKLAQTHLKQEHPSFEQVDESYRDFHILQKLRHSIGPFVASLQLFTVIQKEEINNLHEFIHHQLIENWDQTKLAQVRETKFLEKLKNIMDVDPQRPETMNAVEFVGSLVTEKDGSSPLIEWLRNKSEQDMETMRKILQGHLLEAYRKNFNYKKKFRIQGIFIKMHLCFTYYRIIAIIKNPYHPILA